MHWGQVGMMRYCAALGIAAWFVAAASVPAEELKNSLGITLRLIEAGRYDRGEPDAAPGFSKDHVDFNTADDDRPVHPVVITRPFYMAATEVTVSQFGKFVAATGYRTTAEQNKLGAVGWDAKPPPGRPEHLGTFRDGGGFHWKNPGFPQEESHPVVCVSFTDAQAYCAWLSKLEGGAAYRLPTEAEWEYVARAGTTSYFSFGNVYRGQIHQHANLGNVELEQAFPDRVRRQWLVDVAKDPPDKHVFTAPVGSYQANPWGFFDLHGNVWEWCQDRYLDTAYAAYNRGGYQEVRKRAIDPLNLEKTAADGEWRVIRGGSWFNAPVQCRSSIRGYFEEADAASYLGFRVARDAPAEVVAAARKRFEQSEAARATLDKLTGGLRERRDGRLFVQLRPEHLNTECFTALKQLDELVDLHLDGQGKLQAADLKPLTAALAGKKRLASLIFSGTGPNLADADFAFLAEHPELEQLQLTGTPKLSNALLAHFSQLSRLESLALDGDGITDSGLQTLPPLRGLKSLYLNGTASAGLALARFQGAPLERFSCAHLSDDGAKLLGGFPRLLDLSLAGSPVTGKGLAEIAHLSKLQRLDLTTCRKIADADFAVLGDLYELRSLSLSETAAGDLAAAGLAKLNYLRDLRIGSQQLTDSGARQLCGLVALEFIAINPEATALTDKSLVDLWRLVNLLQLEIHAPQITGGQLDSLRELPRLESLVLGAPATTNAALKNVARSSSLQRFTLGNRQAPLTGVTEAGLLALADAKNLKQLDLINRDKTISDAALNMLRAKRPDLKVNAP